jgi:hypothetical protein
MKNKVAFETEVYVCISLNLFFSFCKYSLILLIFNHFENMELNITGLTSFS